MTSSISVVIIGRNEGERLTRCLESLAPLVRSGSTEVIYVDSASTDGSPERARAAGARVVRVHPDRPCAAIGRNAGWRHARAPFVLFLDGDTELDPGFVEAALPAFDDPRVAIVWGHRRESRPEASIYNRVLDLDWIYRPGLTEFCGGDALMRTAVLRQSGGFDESLIAGEEPDLCRRIRSVGFEILHIDHAMTRHDLAVSRFGQYWRRAVRAGHAYAEVSRRFARTSDPMWRREARHNQVMGCAIAALPVFAAAAALLLQSAWPLAAAAGLFAALSARAGYKARWKSSNPITLWLYGAHSYFQHVPILAGQIGFHVRRWFGRSRGLIDYKEAV